MDNKIAETAITEIREMTIELRTYTKFQKEQIDELKIIANKLSEADNKHEGRLQKLELIVENQNNLLDKHSNKLQELSDVGKFNWQKFLKDMIPKVILVGMTAVIVGILFSFYQFLPQIQDLKNEIKQIQKGDVQK